MRWDNDPDAYETEPGVTKELQAPYWRSGENLGVSMVYVREADHRRAEPATGRKQTRTETVKIIHADGREELRSYVREGESFAGWSLANNAEVVKDRLRELAQEEGYDVEVLVAPFASGRPKNTEASRRDALANVVSRLRQEGAQFDTIGILIGRPKGTVHRLANGK